MIKRTGWMLLMLAMLVSVWASPVAAQAQDVPPVEDAPVVIVESDAAPWWAVPVSVVAAVVATVGLMSVYESRGQQTVRELGDRLHNSVPEFALKPIQDAAQNAQDAMMNILYTIAAGNDATRRHMETVDRLTQDVTDDITGVYSMNKNPQLIGGREAERGQAIPTDYELVSDNDQGFTPIEMVSDGFEVAFGDGPRMIGFRQTFDVEPGRYQVSAEMRGLDVIGVTSFVNLVTPVQKTSTNPQVVAIGESRYEWIAVNIPDTGQITVEWMLQAEENSGGKVVVQALYFDKVH